MNAKITGESSVPDFFDDPRRAESTTVRCVRRMSRHRIAVALSAALYLGFVVTMHDVMQRPAYWVQGQLSHRSWNNLVTAVALPVLAALCIWFLVRIRHHERMWIAGAYLALTVILSAVFFRTLLCMNIEIVHFPQYAILAVMLFALTGSFGQTIIWTTLAGLMDEGYQFFYLHAHWGTYLDFNDVILNTLGAGLGLVMLYGAGVCAQLSRTKSPPLRPRLLTSPAGVAIGMLVVACAGMYAAGLLRLLPSADINPWTIVLRRGGPLTRFWTFTDWGKTYHEVQPAEWVVITIVLIAVYALLDRVSPPEKPRE